jgi:E3 ubiquitin-protein ligase RNF13
MVLLNIPVTDAIIYVLNKENRTYGIIENVAPALFGPELTDNGTWGHLDVVTPRNACEPIPPAPVKNPSWIALIERGDCDFDVKVYNAMHAKYVAVIVYNRKGDDLVRMGGGALAKFVKIPSVLIGHADGEDLAEFNQRSDFWVVIDDSSAPAYMYMVVPLLVVVCLFAVISIVLMGVRCFLNRRRKRKQMLPKNYLKKIPVKKFKKGDDYDVCAICLDEYEEGEKLRILPCSHAYHQKCIDPWLTENKKTCPICKRSVVKKKKKPNEQDVEDGDSSDERRPLLPAQDLRAPVRGGGTFNLPSQPADDDSSWTEDDSVTEVSSSVLTSDVEVHRVVNAQPLPGLTAYSLVSETASSDGVDDVVRPQPPTAADTHRPTPPQGGSPNEGLEITEEHFDDIPLSSQHASEAASTSAATEAEVPSGEATGGQNNKGDDEVVVVRQGRKKKHSKKKRNNVA